MVFLSVEKQKSLGYRTAEILPFNTYSRKTIGYLYAIQHGAKIIYETDDDNYPYGGKIEFHQAEKGEFLVYKTDNALVNPYEHFGQSSIWPRGYPLESIANPPQHTFVRCKNVRALIQQGVVNGDPDVDAIFRLTRKDLGVTLNVEFDAKAPPVLLPPGTYAPFNSQNTLFLYDAFWGLMMPPGPAMRVTDIWRAYYDKRLLEEIDGYLAFFGPNAYQERNSHSYLADFIDEKALYHDAGRLVAYLGQWKSSKADLFNRILELTVDLVGQKILEPIDAVVMEAWLTDLYSLGYVMPALKAASRPCAHSDTLQAKVMMNEEKPASYIRAGKTLKNILKL